MAESNENVAKTGENPKENGVKVKEVAKTCSPVNGKHNVDTKTNGNSGEKSNSIIQKSTPTQAHKSQHTSPQSSSCTTEASHINHVVPKNGKSKHESRSSHGTPSRDKDRQNGHGKNDSE